MIIAIVAGGGLAVVEYRILWGYWQRPVTVISGTKADRVQAVCPLKEAGRGELVPEAGAVVDLANLCGSSGLGSCLEGETLLELFGNNAVPATIPGEIDGAVWSPLWQAVRIHNQSATASGLGTPAFGTAIQFTSAGRTFEWVKYSTHELEDDWYRVVQVLYAFTGDQPELVRWNSYRYQIAGLEDTPTWLLWIVNAVVLAIGGAYSLTGESPAMLRRNRVLKAIASGVLLFMGLAFGLVALLGVHQHDPWLVVLLITATLTLVSGAAVALVNHDGRTATIQVGNGSDG